jgi:hypothetical protein
MKTYGRLEAYIIRAIKEGECNGGARCTYGGEKIREGDLVGNLKERDHWDSPGMDGRIIRQ